MADELYYEDFTAGRKFASEGGHRVSAEEIKEFAERYDPQPFHLDEAAGESSFFRGLAASGWLTAAIAMRLRVQSMRVSGGMIGAGIDQMRWTEPVRPGDTLRTEGEVLEARPSQKRPEYGVVTMRNSTYNQRGEAVLHATVKFLAPRRPPV